MQSYNEINGEELCMLQQMGVIKIKLDFGEWVEREYVVKYNLNIDPNMPIKKVDLLLGEIREIIIEKITEPETVG